MHLRWGLVLSTPELLIQTLHRYSGHTDIVGAEAKSIVLAKDTSLSASLEFSLHLQCTHPIVPASFHSSSGVLFPGGLQLHHAVLNPLKVLPAHFDFGEDPGVSWCWVQWEKWRRTQGHVLAAFPSFGW